MAKLSYDETRFDRDVNQLVTVATIWLDKNGGVNNLPVYQLARAVSKASQFLSEQDRYRGQETQERNAAVQRHALLRILNHAPAVPMSRDDD